MLLLYLGDIYVGTPGPPSCIFSVIAVVVASIEVLNVAFQPVGHEVTAAVCVWSQVMVRSRLLAHSVFLGVLCLKYVI